MNRILAVCTANLVRSPYLAAALTRVSAEAKGQLKGEFEFDSAGLSAVAGQALSPNTLWDVRLHDIELTKHRSRQVVRDDLRRSSLILGLTEAHREALQILLPSATARTFTVTEFVRLVELLPPLSAFGGDFDRLVATAHQRRPRVLAAEAPEDVADPMGKSGPKRRQCLDTLADLAERIVARLR